MGIIGFIEVFAFIALVLFGLAQLFMVAFFSPVGGSPPRKAKAPTRTPKDDLELEAAIEKIVCSAYTATIREIMEGPGTEEEKEIARQKFIASCELGPQERAVATELRAQARRQPNIAPWEQG